MLWEKVKGFGERFATLKNASFRASNLNRLVPWSNAFWPGLTPFGPPMWQAEADTELTLSASPTTAVGQKALALAKRRYSTVHFWILLCTIMDFDRTYED